MCYKKPGPRCSNHARSALREARKAFNEANRAHASDPSDATERKLAEAAKEYKKVKGEYYTTEAGWGELQAKIAQAKTDETRKRLTRQLQDYQDRRGAMLSRYKAEEGELNGEGLTESELSKDAELVAKHDRTDQSEAVSKIDLNNVDMRKVMSSADTSEADLRELASNGFFYSEDYAHALINHPAVKSDMLDTVSTHPHTFPNTVAMLVEKSPLSAGTLTQLSTHEDAKVRKAVGGCERTPEDTLNALSRDKSPEVRNSVAGNPSTPAETLTRFSKSKSSDIHAQLASNPSVPPEALHRVATTTHLTEVKEAVFDNPSVSRETIEQYSNSPDWNLRRRARNVQAARGW